MASTRASRRRNATVWTGAARNDHLDGLFAQMREQAAHELHRDDIVIGTETDRLIVGLPLPALCLRWLFKLTVFPLSRIVQLVGEEGSAKTAFLFELMRWHMQYGGGGVLAETENKDSPTLRNSLWAWNPTWMSRFDMAPCYAMEDWQEVLSTFLAIAAKQQDDPALGRTIPICFGVDSLTAVLPRKLIQNIKDEGHAALGHPLMARLIADFMRAMPQMIKSYPFTIVGTNHLKPGQDQMGRPQDQIPGGKSVKFMETFEIGMKRAPGCDIDLLEYGGLRVVISMRKNSLGPSRMRFPAELLWWYQELGGRSVQMAAWDWDTATIELLTSFETARGKKTLFNDLMDIVDIRVTDRGRRKAWSNTLGVPQTSPVYYRQLGALLEQRSDLLTQLHERLGIAEHTPFQPGVDYRTLMEQEQQRAEAVEAAAADYQPPTTDAMPELSGNDSADDEEP